MGVHQFLSQSSSFTSCDVQVCCMQSGLTSDWEWWGWFVWHSYLGNIKNILNLIGVYWTSLYYNIAQIKYYDPIITSAKQDATWSSTLLPKSLDGQLCQLYLVKKKHAPTKNNKRLCNLWCPLHPRKLQQNFARGKQNPHPMPAQLNELRIRKRPQRTIHRVLCKACACR